LVIPHKITKFCQKSVADEYVIWVNFGMTYVKGPSSLSYNSVVLMTEIARTCVMLAIFTSVMEA
jgi:hypothetical protein